MKKVIYSKKSKGVEQYVEIEGGRYVGRAVEIHCAEGISTRGEQVEQSTVKELRRLGFRATALRALPKVQ